MAKNKRAPCCVYVGCTYSCYYVQWSFNVLQLTKRTPDTLPAYFMGVNGGNDLHPLSALTLNLKFPRKSHDSCPPTVCAPRSCWQNAHAPQQHAHRKSATSPSRGPPACTPSLVRMAWRTKHPIGKQHIGRMWFTSEHGWSSAHENSLHPLQLPQHHHVRQQYPPQQGEQLQQSNRPPPLAPQSIWPSMNPRFSPAGSVILRVFGCVLSSNLKKGWKSTCIDN